MRNEQLIRQWKILCLLSTSAGMTYRQIRTALEPDDAISLRTLQRDLQALEMAGFALESARLDKEVVWSVHLSRGPPLPIQPGEVVSLYAASLAAQVQKLPERARLKALCDKLLLQLPSKTRNFLEAAKQALLFLGPAVSPSGSSSGHQPSTLPESHDSLAEHVARWAVESKTAEILYDSLNSGRCDWRCVDPYAVITTPSGSYLWGYCHRTQQFRVFHLARIRQIRPAGEFRKLEISPSDTFQHAFEIWQGKPERVCVRLTGRAAVLAAERTCQQSQIIRKTRTGIELRLNVNPGKDLERWILGFGSDAEVIAPRSLRDRIAAELNGALENVGCRFAKSL